MAIASPKLRINQMDPAKRPTALAIFCDRVRKQAYYRRPRDSQRIRPQAHTSTKQLLATTAGSVHKTKRFGEQRKGEKELDHDQAMASLSFTAVSATAARPSVAGRRRRLRVVAMAAQKPKPKTTAGTIKRRSGTTTVFPVGEPATTAAAGGGKAVKLLTNVERLRLLTKAERAGLLSAAERAGLSLSAVERLGLLSKAEELGALSAAADPATPGALLALVAAPLLAAGPAVAYLVPEDHAWQVALQAVAALVCAVGGAAAVAASSFVSRLQGSSSSTS